MNDQDLRRDMLLNHLLSHMAESLNVSVDDVEQALTRAMEREDLNRISLSVGCRLKLVQNHTNVGSANRVTRAKLDEAKSRMKRIGLNPGWLIEVGR